MYIILITIALVDGVNALITTTMSSFDAYILQNLFHIVKWSEYEILKQSNQLKKEIALSQILSEKNGEKEKSKKQSFRLTNYLMLYLFIVLTALVLVNYRIKNI